MTNTSFVRLYQCNEIYFYLFKLGRITCYIECLKFALRANKSPFSDFNKFKNFTLFACYCSLNILYIRRLVSLFILITNWNIDVRATFILLFLVHPLRMLPMIKFCQQLLSHHQYDHVQRTKMAD